MNVAAFTFVYNESVNLPIWLRYYGANFGAKNLYVIDRESTDGSTDNLGEVNKINLPRDAFDEPRRAKFISMFHECLLQYYDAVIFTDTDEILVPNLAKYENLAEYLAKNDFEYATAIGLNVCHAIHLEEPIDLTRPLLAQRKYARFSSAQSKTLISRVPTTWLSGFHSTNHPPMIDQDLFIFHIKLIDFYEALHRQRVNRETDWAETSLEQNFGTHHRWDIKTFVQQGFFVTVDLVNKAAFSDFEFSTDIAKFHSDVVEKNGFYYIPMDRTKLVIIPDHLRTAF